MKVAMIGHKVVPSRRGGIENVLTTLCPMLVRMGIDVTCYNRSSDKVENEYVGTVKNNMYNGVKIKNAWTINARGAAAMIASFTAFREKMCCNRSRARLAAWKMGQRFCVEIHKIRGESSCKVCRRGYSVKPCGSGLFQGNI